MSEFIRKAKAVMIGHAVGDALGVPVEFRTREYLEKNPINDMIGYGTHSVPKGTWSDDTSMSLCALKSFEKGKIDYNDIMRNFGKWFYYSQFTATNEMFDVGNTCGKTIHRFFKERYPYNKCGLSDEYSNGNGSLMRIHPFTLYLIYKNSKKISLNHIQCISEASALTHSHARSRVACIIYSFILWELIENPSKESIKRALENVKMIYVHYSVSWGTHIDEYKELKSFHRLFEGIEKIDGSLIKSDGYVVNTLEAAVWCLLTTNSYKECVLKAVNLGDDTDTTAAVAGGLAGALYGYDEIPEEWRNTLIKKEYIEELCEKAFN